MSTTASGWPIHRSAMSSDRLGGRAASTLEEGFGTGGLLGFAAPGQAWIGHEILVGIEGFLPFPTHDTEAGAGCQYRPALLVVEQIRHHDLVLDLLVNRRVEDGHHHLHAAVEVALHEIGRGDVERRFGMRERMAHAEDEDAT